MAPSTRPAMCSVADRTYESPSMPSPLIRINLARPGACIAPKNIVLAGPAPRSWGPAAAGAGAAGARGGGTVRVQPLQGGSRRAGPCGAQRGGDGATHLGHGVCNVPRQGGDAVGALVAQRRGRLLAHEATWVVEGDGQGRQRRGRAL